MTKTPKGDNTDNDIQAIGHQIGSLASVLVVAAVQFGIPLTPGQQSSILSVIAVAWAFFATIYGIRHRIPRRTRNDQTSQMQSTTTTPATQNRAPRSRVKDPAGPGYIVDVTGTTRPRPESTCNTMDQSEPGKVP